MTQQPGERRRLLRPEQDDLHGVVRGEKGHSERLPPSRAWNLDPRLVLFVWEHRLPGVALRSSVEARKECPRGLPNGLGGSEGDILATAIAKAEPATTGSSQIHGLASSTPR